MRINRIISVLICICIVIDTCNLINVIKDDKDVVPMGPINIESKTIVDKIVTINDLSKLVIPEPVHQEPIVDTKKLTRDEVDLISRVVMAEAESEPFEGKVYVIDTILNRVDSKHFPNTVYDVIYQPSQFTSMWNGRYNRCSVNEQLYDVINQEYNNRSNSDIVFFTADNYGQYGRPSFSVADHYFSTYK